MIISLSANGTIHTIQPEKINQGSNKINTIYVIAPLSTGTTIEMSFELPNGEITQSYVLLKGAEIEQGLNTWYLDVSSYLSQYKGIVRYQLKGTINGEVVATGKGSFNIIEGVDWQLPPTPDENTYQLILNKIAQIDTETLNTKAIAEDAKQQADSAVVLSNSAKQIAEGAKVVADEASQVANAIDGKATTALENSQNAVDTANNAIEIANGANKSKAFDTFVDMANFIKVKANVDTLTVGSSLYIKATDVPDYWVTEKLETPNELGYYCNIQALESKLPDISNMVTTDTDQTISGSKDFTGGLKKNGKTVATEEQVNALGNVVSSHTEQITALNGQINTQSESIVSLQTTKADKSELPTKVSDLQNDAEYVTESELTQKDYATNTAVSTNYVKKSDYQEFATNVNTAMTELSDSVDVLQAGKADKTEIPTNADFTLAGLSEKSYNSLTDKPIIPDGVKIYDKTGQNTDGAMTQKASTDNFALKSEIPTDYVTTNTEQEISADKTFAYDVVIKRRLTVYDETNQYNCWVKSYALDGFKLRLVRPLQPTALPLEVMKLSSDGNNTIQCGNVSYPLSFNGSATKPTYNSNNLAFESDIPTKTSQLTNDSEFVTSSAIPTKTSDLTNDSGFITDSTVPSKFQPAMKTFVTTIASGSNYTPEKNGWFVFNITSWNNSSNAMCRLDNSSGIIIFSTLANSTGSMAYNNAPAGIIPVAAGRTYYVYRNGFNCQYFTD